MSHRCGFDDDDDLFAELGIEDDDPDDDLVPCGVCGCIIGEEVAYGDTWDGRWICEDCAGTSET